MAVDKLLKVKPTWWTLLNGSSITSTEATVNTLSGRKFSDFAAVLICINRGNIIRVTQEVPLTLFSNANYFCSLNEVDSANTQRYYEVHYVSDTSVKIKSSPNAGTAYVYVYGLGDNTTY